MYCVSRPQYCSVVLLGAAVGAICSGIWHERLVYLAGRKSDWTILTMHHVHDLECLAVLRHPPLE